mmetsp:Transcript_38545/g.60757  ORF Transcript_38545/g.60757 Transcript_38545/m.60757 type:complete len:204 (-) Transcript_38545:657-1268(-)
MRRHRVQEARGGSGLTWEQQEVQRHAPHAAARLGTVLRARRAAAAEARLGTQCVGPVFIDLGPVGNQAAGLALRGLEHLVAGGNQSIPVRCKVITFRFRRAVLRVVGLHVVSAHAIDPGRVVAGVLPLAAPATPAGAQLDNAMSARRGGDGGAQVELFASFVGPLSHLLQPLRRSLGLAQAFQGQHCQEHPGEGVGVAVWGGA